MPTKHLNLKGHILSFHFPEELAVYEDQYDVALYLLDYNRRYNYRNLDKSDGEVLVWNTIFDAAVRSGHKRMVNLILEYKYGDANIHYRIEKALELGYDDIAFILIEYEGAKEEADYARWTKLAVYYRRTKFLEVLFPSYIVNRVVTNFPPFLNAIHHRYLDVVKIL